MARPVGWIGIAVGVAGLLSVATVETAATRVAARLSLDMHLAGGQTTPVRGPSTLHRLGLHVTESPMGSAGLWGPPPAVAPVVFATSAATLPEGYVVVTGADLYRIDCQGCHRADGMGAPDQVKAMVDPIQSMSPVMMLRRMQARGRSIDPGFARELASDSRKDILKRLKEGGDKMPAFDHLQPAEIDALLAYVNALAGVPGPPPTQRVAEPAVRVGEHLVKGTCHTCHDATGASPSPQALMDGEVPPLASILRRRSVGEVIRKVRHGAPIVMGDLGLSYTGRMPVFSYVTDAEVMAAYEYLETDPPQPK